MLTRRIRDLQQNIESIWMNTIVFDQNLKYYKDMLYIIGMNNVLKIMDMKYTDRGRVYLIPIVAVEDSVKSYTNILYWA